jgi:hypothetical protein
MKSELYGYSLPLVLETVAIIVIIIIIIIIIMHKHFTLYKMAGAVEIT